jgi:hypothetical protein
MAIRPKVGGFPYLAETLRLAGVTRKPLVSARVPELIVDRVWAGSDGWSPLGVRYRGCAGFQSRRADCGASDRRAGTARSPSFWPHCGTPGSFAYDVDFAARTVGYFGCNGEEYIEPYPAVDLKSSTSA